ncbi:hypothetical protein [Candidatus Palauibacter sp.]|uniref:hypothetical protein n=1 Tax=Candidatus Palauibacter sp. TaxID=3101350 RepID=UPI003B02A06B
MARSLGLALATGLAVAACADAPVREPASAEIAWVKQVMVHGVPIYATSTTPDEKLLHAAGVLAQFLDNDEDGVPDNPRVHQAILDTGGAIVMTGTEQEAEDMDWRDAPNDTHPATQGERTRRAPCRPRRQPRPRCCGRCA